MASKAQNQANRRNARRSTSPKSKRGKQIVSQNAVKHGFTANKPVIAGEDPAVFDKFKAELIKELNPKGPTEKMLAGRIIDLSWRLKRSGRVQVAAYHVFDSDTDAQSNPDLHIGSVTVSDFSGDKILECLLVHERRIENSLYKTITELQRLQFIRTKYQSLLMDRFDYDDSDYRELREEQQRDYREHRAAMYMARRGIKITRAKDDPERSRRTIPAQIEPPHDDPNTSSNN